MQYRRLGKTELKVSVIGFGSIKLPQISEERAVETVNRALDLGVNFIDTARNYRDSERKVGMAIKSRRDEVYVATKTSAREYDTAMKDLETSFSELDLEKVELLQLHTVSDEDALQRVLAKGGALEALRKVQDQGMADHVGVTIHRERAVMKKAIECGEFETLMVAYSPIDQEGVEDEILPMAKEHDLGVIIMKSLSGGLLCRPNAEEKSQAERDPIAFGSLWHVISNEAVSCAIPGMQRVREVEENVPVGDLDRPMSAEEVKKLRREIGKLGIEFRYGQICLRCGYCQPCPQKIDVPEVFKAHDIFTGYPDSQKHLGEELYRSLEVSPEECIECGECEGKCPARIAIRSRLKEVVKTFDG